MRELRAELPARARDLELLPDPHALLRSRVNEQEVALPEQAPRVLLFRADDLRLAHGRLLLDEAAARHLALARGGRWSALVAVDGGGRRRLLLGGRAAGLRACRCRTGGAK